MSEEQSEQHKALSEAGKKYLKKNVLDSESVLRRQVKKLEEKPSIVKAFDVIVEATSDYLRKIFPHIFELTRKK